MQKQLMTCKNHLRRYTRVRPQQVQATYVAGQQLTFSLKGQGVDYINFDGSCLLVQVSASVLNSLLTFGSVGLIERFRVRGGATDFEDVHHYGRWVWANHQGQFQVFSNLSEARMSPTANTNTTLLAANPFRFTGVGAVNSVWLQIPLMTMFDQAGYFPVYMLAEELYFLFELAANDEALSNVANPTYTIHDIYLLCDTLTAVSRGKLTSTPYRWPAQLTYGILHPLNAAQVLYRWSYDLKKTSLKKWLGMQMCSKSAAVLTQANALRGVNGQGGAAGAWSGPSSWSFSLGGTAYPFEAPLSNILEQWIQLLKYFHRQDMDGYNRDYSINYLDSFVTQNKSVALADGAGANIARYFQCAVFDRLDQIASIMSGIDTERYDIQLELTLPVWPLAAEHNVNFFSYLTYDAVFTMGGGEIKMED